MKKQTLGRGLDSLIPRGEAKPVGNSGLLEIDLTEIVPNDHQPRTLFDQLTLQELAESIRQKGVIQPIVLTKVEGMDKYMIVEGERRWRASGIAGLKSIPAIMRKTETKKERLELALITNAQREDLNSVELARAYSKLIEEFSYRQEDLAVIVGKSRSAIANNLRLLALPQDVLAAVESKTITEGHARTILSLDKQSDMIDFLNIIISKGYSVRQAEDHVKRFKSEPKVRSEQSVKPHISTITNEFEGFFKTKVTIKEKKKGGIIEIKYNSDDDLDTIIKKIRGEVC